MRLTIFGNQDRFVVIGTETFRLPDRIPDNHVRMFCFKLLSGILDNVFSFSSEANHILVGMFLFAHRSKDIGVLDELYRGERIVIRTLLEFSINDLFGSEITYGGGEYGYVRIREHPINGIEHLLRRLNAYNLNVFWIIETNGTSH